MLIELKLKNIEESFIQLQKVIRSFNYISCSFDLTRSSNMVRGCYKSLAINILFPNGRINEELMGFYNINGDYAWYIYPEDTGNQDIDDILIHLGRYIKEKYN